MVNKCPVCESSKIDKIVELIQLKYKEVLSCRRCGYKNIAKKNNRNI